MALYLPEQIVVAEVGPRDGLQSFPRWIETDTKIAMIDRLSDLGLPVIEVSNFAHPKVILSSQPPYKPAIRHPLHQEQCCPKS